MDVSVIIPTHGRPRKLAACLRGLAGQTVDRARFEVLVGIDGGVDEGAYALARETLPGTGLRIEAMSHRGQAGVRNALLPEARGRLLVFLNDDMIPEPGFLEAHVRAHEGAGRPAMVEGDSPWVRHEPDRLFDRLLRETSMVFFHHRMREAWREDDRGRDWGFRHAWLLNLSIPAELVRGVGGLRVFPSTYGYEDDDLAFRISAKFGAPVLFEPRAVAGHDHRMEPADYLEREERLGFAAWGFAAHSPEAAFAMFGRDIATPAEAGYSRAFVERETAGAARAEQPFLNLANIPADAVAGPHGPAIVELIYGQHLPLKRWRWRRGHLRAAVEAGTLRA